MIQLADRVAIVTGGAQGIGYALCERFLGSNAFVSLWDINAAQLDVAKNAFEASVGPGRVWTHYVNIADYNSVVAATNEVRSTRGRIDILINNAAVIGPNAKLVDYPLEAWRQVLEVGVNGTFHYCRAVVPIMIEQQYGWIVNVGSIAGKEGNPSASAYSSAKAALIALTKSLGKEVAGTDIAVNCITPAVARTPGAMAQSPEHIDYMLSRVPRGRFLELEEAAMVAWLVSDENSFTTSAIFDLSGGRATY
jgi:3-oxoacyl-[acyl-carrier protein] reductase